MKHRRPSPALRPLVAIVATSVALLVAQDASAGWPPAVGADLTDPANWPNDPGYSALWNYFSYLPAQAAGAAPYLGADVLLGASGMSIDRAWESSVGSPAVKIAVIDSGILWEEPDLLQQAWLNAGELLGAHMPRTAAGLACGGKGALAGYDCNGDGVFTVADYAADPRITPVVPGDKCRDPATGALGRDRIAGDVNHNCVLDAGDIIELFSDGVDDDANGYTDDISGWDFLKNDNNPYDDTRSGHGTTAALEADAEGNNGIGSVGVCPTCRLLVLRAGDSLVVDSNDVAKALVYGAENGASVALLAVDAVNLTGFARAAIDYAYGKDVVVVASMGDDNARHHELPATYSHTLTTHAIGYDGASVASSTSFLDYVNCTNFGGQLALSASGSGCSDEAAARTAGVVGLLESYALALDAAASASMPSGAPVKPLTAEEVMQLVKTTADVVNVPESRARAPGAASTYYESLPGFSQRFGYGRVNAASAARAIAAGLVPPQVEILSPGWFDTLYADRTLGSVPLFGRVVASRAPAYDVSVEWAPGVEPLDASFQPLITPVTNIPGQTVTGGATTPLALLDAAELDTAHTADPDSPQHENDRTITVRVRAVAHYASGDVTGEARRTLAIVNEANGLDPSLLPGFPLQLSGSVEGGVKLADLDGDGVRDIVLATNDGLVHAFSAAGPQPVEIAGFPYALLPIDGLDPTSPVPSVPSYLTAPAYVAGANGGIPSSLLRESVDATPAIGAVAKAGALDVVFVSWAGTVYVVDSSGRDEPGWPVRLPLVPSCSDNPAVPNPPGDCMDVAHALGRGAYASPVLYDFDGDGVVEVVVAAFDGNVYVFRGDGSLRPGFPVRVHSPDAYRYDRIMSTPAIADFNADGVPDILVGTNETVGRNGSTGFYYVIDGNGTLAKSEYLADWPLQIPSTYASPVLGQGTTASPVAFVLGPTAATDALLQGNGAEPLVVPGDPGMQSGSSPPSSALPASSGGSPGFAPLTLFGARSTASPDEMLPLFSHPSVGDLDQDGTPDVVMSGGGKSLELNLAAKTALPFQQLLGMWSGATGQMIPGSPVVLEDYTTLSGQAIADITGDNYPEVIVGTGGYFVHAVDACGQEAAGWPKFTDGWTMSTPAVGDVTGDHMLEVVAATREGFVYAWTTLGTDTGVVAWESFHHDNANTGNYGTALRQGAPLVATTPLVCTATGSADGGTTPPTGTQASTGGCSCTLEASRTSQAGWALLGLVGVVGVRRRRMIRSREARQSPR